MSQLSREDTSKTKSAAVPTKFDMPVEEFTTPDPFTAVESTSIQDLVDLMKKYDGSTQVARIHRLFIVDCRLDYYDWLWRLHGPICIG